MHACFLVHIRVCIDIYRYMDRGGGGGENIFFYLFGSKLVYEDRDLALVFIPIVCIALLYSFYIEYWWHRKSLGLTNVSSFSPKKFMSNLEVEDGLAGLGYTKDAIPKLVEGTLPQV